MTHGNRTNRAWHKIKENGKINLWLDYLETLMDDVSQIMYVTIRTLKNIFKVLFNFDICSWKYSDILILTLYHEVVWLLNMIIYSCFHHRNFK